MKCLIGACAALLSVAMLSGCVARVYPAPVPVYRPHRHWHHCVTHCRGRHCRWMRTNCIR